ncbi:hypothetical protein BDV38DRAFT_290996 [Aspergillus pseudotamarii]|uniref:MmgE/PrpD family-domain-containing protein n=1 Tax=Aspergillus pseudotamarii TaxID=132259 RepID=A0A5N6T0P3_ASPPS|nr:uncharacterized protein BDV38DRAFT_290996 [Aspergillus pseudotamarii]KAE8139709.1 hypothetical protein BDV38DRAFT_290996 [Aspergillus pseudotamarii]
MKVSIAALILAVTSAIATPIASKRDGSFVISDLKARESLSNTMSFKLQDGDASIDCNLIWSGKAPEENARCNDSKHLIQFPDGFEFGKFTLAIERIEPNPIGGRAYLDEHDGKWNCVDNPEDHVYKDCKYDVSFHIAMPIFYKGFLTPPPAIPNHCRGSEDCETMTTRTERLATWASGLQYDDIPQDVIQRTKDLFLDWFGCTIAGRHHPAVKAIAIFVQQMGPTSGKSELVDSELGFSTSPAFAAMVNAASSHVVEQDDLHNRSILHPATVIFPAALAVAQDVNANGRDFITACVVGYEVGCRVGEFLGKSHYARFHSTATGGVIGVAAATARLLGLDSAAMLSSIGTAGTQASGLWQFLLDATHSKQVHTGKACFDGIFAAYAAKSGLLGPKDVLEGPKGMGVALVPDTPIPTAIDTDLGLDWAVLGSSFKWHASCRHTHPSVDALLHILSAHAIKFEDIDSVVTRTYQAAFDVLGLSGRGETIHQSKFNMGFVLAVTAQKGQALITDFKEEALQDASLRNFQERVRMELDEDINAAFPQKWQGQVIVTCKSGERYEKFVEYLKGDPQSPLTRNEIETKFKALAQYGGVKDADRIQQIITRAWNLENQDSLKELWL